MKIPEHIPPEVDASRAAQIKDARAHPAAMPELPQMRRGLVVAADKNDRGEGPGGGSGKVAVVGVAVGGWQWMGGRDAGGKKNDVNPRCFERDTPVLVSSSFFHIYTLEIGSLSTKRYTFHSQGHRGYEM
jgi:hypothetical protein